MKTELPGLTLSALALSLAVNLGAFGAIFIATPSRVIPPPTTNLVAVGHPPAHPSTRLAPSASDPRIVTLPTIYVYPTYSEQVELARVRRADHDRTVLVN